MGTVVKQEFEKRLIPPGVHRATCCWVIDLGTVFTPQFNKHQSKVMIAWELADVRVTIPASEKGPERTYLQRITKTYTASLDQRANLRQHLDAWRGVPFKDAELKGFELRRLLGASCLIQVMHEESGGEVYANIKSIMALPEGTPRPTLEAEVVFFDMDQHTPIPANLPSWLLEKIAKSPEYQERYAQHATQDGGDFYFGTGAPDPFAAPAGAGSDGCAMPVGGQGTGLGDALLENEARGLAQQLKKPQAAVELAIGTARRHGTLGSLVAEWRRLVSGGNGAPVDWTRAPAAGASPVAPPAPPATAAPAGAPPPKLEDELYDLGEVLGYTAGETRKAIEAAKAGGQLDALYATWAARAKQGAA